MNYGRIYDELIERGKNRILEGYYEVHHIVPRCLGGDDSKDNLVNLTPEEHYVAHQLLVKTNPNHRGLVFAAAMMCVDRTTNKLYGWLRRRASKMQSEWMSTYNHMTNKRWISNENQTILVEGVLADRLISSGEYIAGKIAIRLDCGHLVRKRCIVCEDRRRKSLEKKNEEAKIMAHQLFEEFKQSDAKSVCEFAKIKNTSQPRLTQIWKKYVEEYALNRQQGKSFK